VAHSELGRLQEKRESLVAQLDEIDSEILSLKKKRHAELMAEIHELGLIAPATVKVAGDKKITRQRNPSKVCPVCEFKTNPPHDSRAHKSQKTKAPFTPEELDQRNFQVVS
jgi:DNA repair exonuclease SbcCD ATPase subunit